MRFLRTAIVLLSAAPLLVSAQGAYREPPAPIAKILDADPAPAASISPDKKWLLLLEREGLPPISEIAAQWHGLAGDRINPRTNMRAREASFRGLVLRSIDGSIERRVTLPSGTRAAFPMWAPDGKRVAFVNLSPDGGTLWMADVASGRARQLAAVRLNGTTGAPCTWIGMTPQMLCKTVVAARGAAPRASEVPAGPIDRKSVV